MKTFTIATAAALLLGTSAYAMTPSTEPTGIWVKKDPHMVTGATATGTAAGAAKLQPAAADWWDNAEPVAYGKSDAGAKSLALAQDDLKADAPGTTGPMLASSDKFAAIEDEWDAAAAAKEAAEDELALEAEPDPAAMTALDEEPVPVGTGVGGPYEGVDMAAADLTPRPAAQNYPACRPVRGDDNCIQLYEPGVRAQLASWEQPTGGFAGTADAQVAMGGPYEPVADSATETERLNRQALADSNAALQAMQMADAGSAEDAALVQQAELEDEAALEMAADPDPDDEKPVEV